MLGGRCVRHRIQHLAARLGAAAARDTPGQAWDPEPAQTHLLAGIRGPGAGGRGFSASPWAGGPPCGGLEPSTIVAAAGAAEAATIGATIADTGYWVNIGAMMHALEAVHSVAGLPWWAAIPATTVLFRTAILPVAVYQIKNASKMGRARPDTEILQAELQRRIGTGANPDVARQWYMEQIAATWVKYDCHPAKSFVGIVVNGTMFISFFLALRGLADAKVPSLTHGGLLWFQDLTAADPFYVLPLVSSALMLLTVELGAMDGMEGQTSEMMNRMKWVMRVLSVGILPFTLKFQSAVLLYWIASNSFSLGQTMLLKRPTIRTALGLPLLKVKKPPMAPAAGAPVKTFQYSPKAKRKPRTA